MEELNQYVKIVVISTLAEKKTLSDISTTWFKNKGRLYQPAISKEIKKAVEKELLIQDKKSYKANLKKVIEILFSNLGDKQKEFQKYKTKLINFYENIKDYSKLTYLNFSIIEELTKFDLKKTSELDIRYLLLLPFLLRYIELKDKTLENIIIQILKLENYIKTIEKLEIQNYHILKSNKEIDKWVKEFEWLSKNIITMQKKGLNIFDKNRIAIKTLGEL